MNKYITIYLGAFLAWLPSIVSAQPRTSPTGSRLGQLPSDLDAELQHWTTSKLWYTALFLFIVITAVIMWKSTAQMLARVAQIIVAGAVVAGAAALLAYAGF